MNHLSKKNHRYLPLAAAFLIPFLGMLAVMAALHCTPFGSASMLYSDMYHQYFPFFADFHRALRSGGSLLYSWGAGLGMDYPGLISYYLASPFNLLSILVPEKWLLSYFSLLVPVKLGLAGFFFAVFLKKTFGRSDSSIAVFGGLYGLCAWALGYQWNIMWLDTFALLPLVVLGVIQLRNKKYVLYTVSLFLSVAVNYYIGFFTCIFVLLLFFCIEICRWKGKETFLRDFVRIALFSALAIGMTAFLSLPALAALSLSQAGVNTFPTSFSLNIANENTFMGLLSAMRSVAGNMCGGIVPTFKTGLPNLYCGVGTIVFGWLFFMAKDVKRREKLCAAGLLVFFNLSFVIRQLDYIWHGFHFPNMLPYRFSFLYSFVLLCMAYRAWTLKNSFFSWNMLFAASGTMLLITCSSQIGADGFLVFNLAFLAAYIVALLYGCYQKPVGPAISARRRQSALLVLLIMAAELSASLVQFQQNFPPTDISNYPSGTEDAELVLDYMRETEGENTLYRAETTHTQTLNDGALNGYNGISTFASSANVGVTDFMRALGFGAKDTYNRYYYEEGSPVSNLFLGLKYQINRDGRNKESSCFDEVFRQGGVSLLQNRYYLPIGFLADPALQSLPFDGQQNWAEFQNSLLTAASGVEESAWQLMTGQSVTVSAEGAASVQSDDESGRCSYQIDDQSGAIVYTYQIPADGFMTVYVDSPNRNRITLFQNGTELYTESMVLPQMLAVGDVAAGDEVQVRVISKNNSENGTVSVSGAVLNLQVLQRGYDALAESKLRVTDFTETKITGEISCNRDGVLYTSVPQNGGWSVLVDGEPAEISLIGDVMVGVSLTEGDHSVQLVYHSRAFSIGWKISLLCAALFALAVLVPELKRPKLLHVK